MMTQTPHVLEKLSLYLDHALGAADQVAVKSHLNECAHCRRRSEQMIQLRQSLKTTETLVPPESFYQGVLARIEAKASEKRRFSWEFSAKALASACLVFIAVWVSRDSLFPPRPTSPISSVAQREKQEKVSSSADSLASAPGAALAPKKVETFYEPQDTSGIIARRQSGVVEEKEADIVDAKPARVPETPVPERADQELVRDENRPLLKSMALSASSKEVRAASEMEWHGHDSAIVSPREIVVRNLAEWQAFWKEHTDQKFFPAPPLPDVDFNRSIVVGVFLGNRGSGGYSAQVVSVQETGTECVVLYREIVPPADSVQTMAMTQPFHLKVVPPCTLPLHFQKL